MFCVADPMQQDQNGIDGEYDLSDFQMDEQLIDTDSEKESIYSFKPGRCMIVDGRNPHKGLAPLVKNILRISLSSEEKRLTFESARFLITFLNSEFSNISLDFG